MIVTIDTVAVRINGPIGRLFLLLRRIERERNLPRVVGFWSSG